MLVNMKKNYRKRMEENPEKEREDRRRWKEENKEHYLEWTRKYWKKRYESEPNFRLARVLRSNTSRIIKNGCTKRSKTLKMLGCSVKTCREWLESQFTSEMSWDNHGKYWHIDHFLPIACFDLEKKEEQDRCFHWSNLQPLPGKINISKHCSIPSEEEQELHQQKIDNFKAKNEEEKSILPGEPNNVNR